MQPKKNNPRWNLLDWIVSWIVAPVIIVLAFIWAVETLIALFF